MTTFPVRTYRFLPLSRAGWLLFALVVGALVAIALWSAAAHAQTPAAAGAASSLLSIANVQKLVFLGITLFGASILAAIAVKVPAATKAAVAWVEAHSVIKGHAAATASIQRFEDILGNILLAAENTAIPLLQADLAAGKLNAPTYKDALAELKTKEIAEFKTQVSNAALTDDLHAVVAAGAGATGASPAVETWAATTIEALLGDIKKPAAPAPVVVPAAA